MRINVLNELRQPVGTVTVFDLQERAIKFEDTTFSALTGRLTLIRTNRGLLATLDADAVVPECCARCLAQADCPIHIEFEEEYIPLVDANSGARIRHAEADDGFRIGPDFVLDPSEPLRQYMLMLEPLKPLCRPDCAGLCPSCGVDLNIQSCECRPAVDERWGVLARLSARQKER
jgi:DUF177 domain-containing protein